MRVLAAVVSWNSAGQLADALASLAAQTDPPEELTVIDNASVDASREVAGAVDGVRLVANPVNRGFAGAANQAAARAAALGADALLLCNPDVRLEPEYLARVVAALGADDARAAVQGRLWRWQPGRPLAAPGARVIDTTGHRAFRTRLFRNRGEGERDVGQFDAAGEIFGVSGAVGLYRLAALTDVAVAGEIFDEDLFAYWEDIDLDWRLRARGWRAWYEPTACGWHERGGAGPRRSATVEALNFANRLLVVAKNDDPRALLRAAPELAVTTALKAGELALTVPSAVPGALRRLGLLRRALARRRLQQVRATVSAAEIAAAWFEPFDYPGWVRGWWRRIRSEHARQRAS